MNWSLQPDTWFPGTLQLWIVYKQTPEHLQTLANASKTLENTSKTNKKPLQTLPKQTNKYALANTSKTKKNFKTLANTSKTKKLQNTCKHSQNKQINKHLQTLPKQTPEHFQTLPTHLQVLKSKLVSKQNLIKPMLRFLPCVCNWYL